MGSCPPQTQSCLSGADRLRVAAARCAGMWARGARYRRRCLLLCACLWTLACMACVSAGASAPAPLRVWAASSLTAPFTELSRIWAAEGHDTDIELVFGSSQYLVLQLSQGAPGDVLATADYRQVERGIAAGLTDAAAVVPFAGNSLTLAVHPDAMHRVQGLSDLTQPDLRLAWARDGVPLAVYTGQLLARWVALEGDEALRAQVQANILTYDANARSVRNRLLQGEADAAILYTSDVVAQSRALQAIPLDPVLHVPTALYAMPLHQTRQPCAVQAFIEFLTGPVGQAVLQAHGFVPHGAE